MKEAPDIPRRPKLVFPHPEHDTDDIARRARRKNVKLIAGLVIGFVIFALAAGALYYALQPIRLRIAVGPPNSDDQKVIAAMVDAFAEEASRVRLSAVEAAGPREAVALLSAGKADLAIARADIDLPAEIQTVAILRKNVITLWSNLRKLPAGKDRKTIKTIEDLGGRSVGIIGQSPANATLLKTILTSSGVQESSVGIKQFGNDQLEELARDTSLDAFMAVGPLDSTITAQAVLATARSRGEPVFLTLETSEAIAAKQRRYEAEEIPPGIFNAHPMWPPEKLDALGVNHLILAPKALAESRVAAFFRQLFAARQAIATKAPGAAHIAKPDTEKDADITLHRGAASVIDGTERTFLDKYGDYFWFGLLFFSGIGSAAAWLRHYLYKDEREQNSDHRDRIVALVSRVRAAHSNSELQLMQREVDRIISEALECYDDGAIEQEELAAFGLALDLFNHAVIDRRTDLSTTAR